MSRYVFINVQNKMTMRQLYTVLEVLDLIRNDVNRSIFNYQDYASIGYKLNYAIKENAKYARFVGTNRLTHQEARLLKDTLSLMIDQLPTQRMRTIICNTIGKLERAEIKSKNRVNHLNAYFTKLDGKNKPIEHSANKPADPTNTNDGPDVPGWFLEIDRGPDEY